MLRHFGLCEIIYLIFDPFCIFYFWQICFFRFHKSPMFFIFCPLFYPLFKDFNLILTQTTKMRIGRRHYIIRVFGRDTLIQFRLFGLATHNRKSPLGFFQRCKSRFFNIQSKIRFTLIFVGTMTRKTFIRQNRTDVEIVTHLVRHGTPPLSITGVPTAKNGD